MVSQPAGHELHVIADNLRADQAKKVFEFLEANPTVRIHYAPTYSSWINQVKIWFSKIQRDNISRGVFTSEEDLARKLIRYIRNYNKSATPPNAHRDDRIQLHQDKLEKDFDFRARRK